MKTHFPASALTTGRATSNGGSNRVLATNGAARVRRVAVTEPPALENHFRSKPDSQLILTKGGNYGAVATPKGTKASSRSLTQNTIKSPSRGAATNSRPGLRKIYASDAERQRARRIRRYAAGLNSQGRPYQRHPHFVNWAETPALRKLQIAEQRERKLQNNLARYHRLARANRAAGLRVDGQPFRRHPRFAAWKHFRAALAPAPLGNWERIER